MVARYSLINFLGLRIFHARDRAGGRLVDAADNRVLYFGCRHNARKTLDFAAKTSRADGSNVSDLAAGQAGPA